MGIAISTWLDKGMKKTLSLCWAVPVCVLFFSCDLQGGCENLGEKDCRADDSCHVRTGPSTCSGDICTDDLTFKGCRKATEKEVSHRKKMRRVKAGYKIKCAATKGRWLEPNEACSCGAGRFFMGDRGCTSLEESCKEVGGEFYPVGKFECNDDMRGKYPHHCKSTLLNPKKNAFELCWCPGGSPWDWRQGCL